MITFRQFALRRGERLLLADIDLTIHAGWRVGVVGRNGCGKSSLFAAIQGEVEPDTGDLDLPRSLRIASVAQETPALPDAAIDYVLGGDAEVAATLIAAAEAEASGDHEAAATAHQHLEHIGGYDARARAGRLLHGLGFKSSTHTQAVGEFSGGWRVRLNLARALMAPSDLLLLDEPTNHLDLDAVVWLEEWLKRYPGTLLLISHDREFLDGIATHILHLDAGRGQLYTGNYASFERQREEQLRQQAISHAKEQAERAHLQSFIDRFKAKASKARQAQSRVKRLEKMQGTEAVRAARPFHAEFPVPQKLPLSLLKLDHVDAGYGKARILHNVRFGLQAGERIGLLGPNGEGKSTLVRTLAGTIEPLAGARAAHPDLRVGYFAQHTLEQLDIHASALEHLARIAPTEGAQVLRSFLGKWDFAGERVFEPVAGFSGGERARLALALIAWRRPNLLLLDEPTNHLDLEMREALAEALNDYPGALVLVAHDRNLMGLVCDSFWRVADGAVVPFDGDLDDYASWLRARRTVQPGGAKDASAPKVSAADRRRAAADQRERAKPLRQRVQAIEKRLQAMQRARDEVEGKLADPELFASGNAAEITHLGQRQNEIAHEVSALEAEWLALSEQLESA